ELMIGRALTSIGDAVSAARGVVARPGGVVCITSLRTPDIPVDRLVTLAVTHEAAWNVETPFLPLDPLPNGMGDVFSALFLGMRLRGATVSDALTHAVSALYALVQRTPIGARDLPLVLEQSVLVEPPVVATAVRIE
ncbi:MAG TPA: pyridoxal kinase, partial [Burkholderiaceae bacterium]|nr:pyridoxal kinase [Burkholderiaceae bacterium]